MNALSELFHVSTSPREASWQPTLKPRTWPTAEKEEIEAALERARPSDLPSRRASYFAFPSIAECVHYAESENLGSDRYFYRVKLLQAVRAPITLTYVPDKLAAHRDAIVRHYWAADDGWKVYEFFAERMIVMAAYALTEAPDTGPVIAKLMADRKRLSELAPTWT